MFKVHFGTAGIPISSAQNTTVSGIVRISELGLDAMEVEFVRGVHMSFETAKEVGIAAQEYGIVLSVHAPYYVNLASEKKEVIEASRKRIIDSLFLAHLMNAKIVVVHAGFYGKNREVGINMIAQECLKIARIIEENQWDVLLGIEASGKQAQFGSLYEILNLCKNTNLCVPVIDFAHIFARQAGEINYAKVLDSVKGYSHIHCHFSGINYSTKEEGRGNERSHEPVGNPHFSPLADKLLRRKQSATIICESPLLEQDAIKMKMAFENARTYNNSDLLKPAALE